MNELIDLLPPIITGFALAIVAWYLRKSQDEAAIRFTSAEAVNELIESQERLQNQVILLSQEMKTMRDDYEREIALLRRRINRYAKQMRAAGIEPINGDGDG